jgi:PIN domain nuclease of toxin-antitoxin system
MILLLDTHTFIWWDSEPERLSETGFALCKDRNNTLLLSMASAWEIQIKYQLGKLTLRMPLADIVANQQESNGLKLLSISFSHILALQDLPMVHRDPFDRLLAAQAKVENIALLTVDAVFAQYPIKVMW